MAKNTISSVMTFVVVITGVCLTVFFHFKIPKVVPFEKGDLRAIYVPDDDNAEHRKALLPLTVYSINEDNPVKSVELFYKEKGGEEFARSEFSRLKNTSIYNDFLPGLPKGKRYFYYIKAKAENGDELIIPPAATISPRPSYYYVTYEGNPSRWALIIHIMLAIGAVIYWVHTFYYSICHIKTGQEVFYRKAYNSAFWGNAAFFIFAVPLGCLIAWEAFGTPWTGVPVGWDITDNKSLITMLFYTGALLAAKMKWVSPRTFSVLGIIGLILTIVVYNIPHSYFIQ